MGCADLHILIFVLIFIQLFLEKNFFYGKIPLCAQKQDTKGADKGNTGPVFRTDKQSFFHRRKVTNGKQVGLYLQRR